MTDINFRSIATREEESAAPARPDDAAELFELIELMFFAYRDFTSDPNAILDQIGFGRAHHRVIHFVNRNPGLKVADLLDILKITKQSLGRVLKQLVDEGYISRNPAPRTGASACSIRRRAAANSRSGWPGRNSAASPRQSPMADRTEAEAAKRFLMNLIDEAERPRVAAIILRGQGKAPGPDGSTE
jgi:hypothetical protein